MKDFLNRDSLEEFISEQADKHRMYPSDKLWKNVRRQVYKPKKWPALPAITMFVISSLVVLTVITKPQHDVLNGNVHFAYNNNASKGNPLPDDAESRESNTTSATFTDKLIQDRLLINQTTERTIAAAEENIKINKAIARQLYTYVDNNSLAAPSVLDNHANTTVSGVSLFKNQQPIATSAEPGLYTTAGDDIRQAPVLTESNFIPYLFDIQSRLKNILNVPETKEAGGAAFFTLPRYNSNIDNLYDFDFKASELEASNSPLEKLSKASSRFDFRFYVTPSVSYRRLKKSDKIPENAAVASAAFLPFESNYRVKPSQAADHHPALGYETGFGLGYKLTNKIKLTGGFQFNISKYKIDAYLYKEEPAALTLTQGSITSTVNTTSSLRSTAGNKPITLRNRYYQLSLPLGIDYTLVNTKRLTWGMATTIQPTYTFDKQPLIFSSNYKNYTDGSVYVRNFNVNAAAETYVGYKSGSYTWQLGPQIRYQLLPSLENKYPNKEYLINYGLKVGVVKSLK